MKIPVYNLQGEQTKDLELSRRIFGVAPKAAVIHQVVVAQQANARPVLAHTKGKGEVSGGGRKPWRQKGTGRSRHGSIRSPLWKGGGITFGPTNERNFTKDVNKKQKQLALAMCLSDKVSNQSLAVFDQLTVAGKTKELKNWLAGVKTKITELKDKKNFLLVVENKDRELERAANNLAKVDVILADSLNCVDILKHDALLASEEAIAKINRHYRKLTPKGQLSGEKK